MPRARSGTLCEAGGGPDEEPGQTANRIAEFESAKASGRARIGFYDALTTNDAQMRDKRHREKIAAGVVEADATIMANERISGSE